METSCVLYSKIKETTIATNHIFSLFNQKMKARVLLLNLLVKERKKKYNKEGDGTRKTKQLKAVPLSLIMAIHVIAA